MLALKSPTSLIEINEYFFFWVREFPDVPETELVSIMTRKAAKGKNALKKSIIPGSRNDTLVKKGSEQVRQVLCVARALSFRPEDLLRWRELFMLFQDKFVSDALDIGSRYLWLML